ncbi:MAG: GNAT family N-acetyltransferase [Yaniella sp.]|uniref:GNAT family N-acetyltransferase n=1 Tax=Yaniella sp. TaxID=2773929 RepID=UPI003F943D71
MSQHPSTVTLKDFCPSPPPTIYATEQYGVATATHFGGTWKYLSNEDGSWGIPLVIRAIPGTSMFDAMTPYGYGGIHVHDSLTEAEAQRLWADSVSVLAQSNIVSVFFRFPPFIPAEAGRAIQFPDLSVERASSTILVNTSENVDIMSSLTAKCRKQVRRGQRDGLVVTVLAAEEDNLREFRKLYIASMDRIDAKNEYYFNENYFDELRLLGERLRVSQVHDSAGHLVASSLVLLDDDVAHLHLVGADNEVRGVNNIRIWALLDWSQKHGIRSVHLGGGVRDRDSLFSFKQSFGGEAVDFHVGKLVVDQSKYSALTSRMQGGANLIQESDDSSFFPAYRRAGNRLIGSEKGNGHLSQQDMRKVEE